MWAQAGIFRERAGLTAALTRVDRAWRFQLAAGPSAAASSPEAWRLTSLLTVSRLIVRAALRREESRGGHSRTDFPETDDLHWKRHVSDRFVP
jgi:L-aspartate oxidase